MLTPRQKEIFTAMEQQTEDMTFRQNLCFVFVLVTTVGPALSVWGAPGIWGMNGFFRGWPLLKVVELTSVGGALGLIFWHPKPAYWPLGLVPGLLIGPCIFGATWLYTFYRDRVSTVELVFPVVIGSLPGFMLYAFLVARKTVAAKARARS